jgi:uncharacterized protein (UPF0210 family)
MDVFAREHDPRTAGTALTEAITVLARAVEAAAMKAAAESGWTYAALDPTPAPGGPVSIGAAIESFTGAPFGSPGTETASGIITRAVQAVPVEQAGYAGLMLAVLEDDTLAFKWNKPLATRLLPAPGKKVGDMTEFSGALANVRIQPLAGSPRR